MTGAPERSRFAYQPFYCEENVWHLVQDAALGEGPRWVVFVSNPARQVALWRQRAGAVENDGLVVWDYHVVALSLVDQEPRVWDLDSTAPFGIGLGAYVEATFRQCAPAFEAQTLVVPAASYVSEFASDRRHMRRSDGSYRQPPPSWPTVGKGSNLDRFVAMRDASLGRVCDARALASLL